MPRSLEFTVEWQGYDPKKGDLWQALCPLADGSLSESFTWVPTGSAPAVPPDPGVVALQVRDSVTKRLPAPVVGISPDLFSSRDPAKQNQPYTLINLWSWYWTDAASWAPVSETAAVNGVSATTTATPTALVFDPGNGEPAVSCGSAPGRAWQVADGGADPASVGGCGFRYTAVTANGPITARLSVTWRVSWTSSTGAVGVLAPFSTSSSTPAFLVEQIQVVNR